MSEFFFKPAARGRCIDLFSSKRDPGRAEYFVNACEREIVSWLKAWPADSWTPTEATAEALERVRVKAGELLQAIERLDAAAAWLLLPLRWRDEERESSHGETREARQAIKAAVMRIRQEAEAIECLPQEIEKAHGPHDGPITRLSYQDLCDRFARAYITAFHELPPYGPGTLFPAFCEEAANAIAEYPGSLPVRITRSIIENARDRMRIHLDYIR